MPEGGVSVARPHRWGNPYAVARYGRDQAIELFEADLRAGRLGVSVEDVRRELAGHPLGCWCAEGVACHADVLLKIANSLTLGPATAVASYGQDDLLPDIVDQAYAPE